MAKTIWREPTPDDPRRRITRRDDELRECVMYFRVSRRELDEMFRYARARKATMSYFIREALREKYPEIFSDMNRHIKKPRKNPLPIEEPTQTLHSYANGAVKILNTKP